MRESIREDQIIKETRPNYPECISGQDASTKEKSACGMTKRQNRVS